MVQYKIDDGGPIEIAYGNDEFTGMFLSVIDRRLEWQENTSEEVNKVINKIAEDGGGGYFDLHTGINGFGQRVTKQTIAVFLKRYGVEEARIRELWRMYSIGGQSPLPVFSTVSAMFPEAPKLDNSAENPPYVHFDSNKCCVFCGKDANQRCAKCQKMGQRVLYCSKECQVKDWPDHKHFCALPFPEKNMPKHDDDSSVYAVLLEENSTKPRIVELPMHYEESDDDESYWSIRSDAIFPNATSSHSNIQANPLKGAGGRMRVLENHLMGMARDQFLTDGSAANKCVQAITGNVFYHAWAGPILIVKHQGSYRDSFYADIELADCGNIIDFFKFYGSRQ